MVDYAPTEREVSLRNPIARNGTIFLILFTMLFVVIAFATALTVYYVMFYMFMLVLILILFGLAFLTKGDLVNSSGFFATSRHRVFMTIVGGCAAGVLLTIVMGTSFSLAPGSQTSVVNGLIDGLPVTIFIFVTMFVAPISEQMLQDIATISMYQWIPRVTISVLLTIFGLMITLLLYPAGMLYALIGVALMAFGIGSYFTPLKGKIAKDTTVAIIISGIFGAVIFMTIHAATFMGQPQYLGILFTTFIFGIGMFTLNLFLRQAYPAILAHGIYNGGVLIVLYGINPVLIVAFLIVQIFIVYMLLNPAGVLKGFGSRKQRYRR